MFPGREVKLESLVSVTELIPYSPEELIGKEDFFVNKIKSFINEVRKERKDLDNYSLNDVGFVPQENAILIKLYFKWDQEENKRLSNTDKDSNNKVIDLTKYL